MKKTINLALLLLAFWACDSNDTKTFERGDANAYFPQEKIGVAVGNTLSIPLNLANIPGTTPLEIKINIQDSTAVEGRDYVLLSGNNYHFDKGVGIEYIVIETLPKDTDSLTKRVFTITLEPNDALLHNERNTVTVEIRNYSRHPLRQLLGDATFTGVDLVQGNVEITYPVNIYPDDTDDRILWLSGITGGIYGGMLPDLQLVVDTLKSKITLPFQSFANRKLGSVSGNLETFKGIVQNNTVYIVPQSDVLLTYDKKGNIYFNDWFGTIWSSGSETDNPLFIYYGNYGGQYNTAILKE